MIKPTAAAKLFATVLAVALLGLVFAAPGIAVEGTDDSGGRPPPRSPRPRALRPSPTAPSSLRPIRRGPRRTGPPPATAASPRRRSRPVQPLLHQKDSEPSHSDKKFCEEFTQKYRQTGAGASSTGGPTQAEKDQLPALLQLRRTPSPPTATRSSARSTRRSTRRRPRPQTAAANGEHATNAENEEAKKEDEPNSGPLAFTGLDVWQLVLLGMVLVGGGLGARKLLAN